MSRLYAEYELETPLDLAHTAGVIAGEQSSGTFLKIEGETDALKAAHGARVESIVELGRSDRPALPCKMKGEVYTRGRITLSWPMENIGPSLPNTLATVAGNLFELREVSALRLLDVAFPDDFARAYPGPKAGIAGTRKLAGVEKGPLIGTIIKPSVGLDAQATAALVKKLAEGGIDFIKDDELQANGPHCPLEARVKAVMRVLNDHAERTGKKPMYAFNISGEIDEMKRGADLVREAGGTCVMVGIHSAGLPGVAALRRHTDLPIHGHRNGWGLFSRSPDIGISFIAWQKFWRIAGVDHLHVNGLRNKFSEDGASSIASAKECLTPLFEGDKDYTVMPVFSSGQSAEQIEDTYAALQSTDLIYCAGGGIMGHPQGLTGGITSLREGWQAAVEGVPLDDYAKTHPALAAAIGMFRARLG
ncbi:ribulose-bisphosphate carboxylase large subunit family protein [Mesorhizobium sp. RMAD-H1]|uniref:ribulose-bisphosphate carboxylase large subunit family protein n=1 Tax=Mesorhizobium sp. RMAD-H1 TaxID=2587065 RepID=UPI001616C543|nr:ribulose-bisphosphate carboxylase large subunit family protein [Mesorhizobium sp. RMAD-H1]MBB2971726.1 ribulose-bisphosphate carboxylase large chain [Mesorhizobium sp. RMAD-H1]